MMKLKKIASIAIAAAMSLSAISAGAVNVPTPADNAEAYALAEEFYHDGYYYEARAELLKVDENEWYYDANKQAAWLDQVNYKINRLVIQEILSDVKKLNSEHKFYEGLIRLQDANDCDITANEYYSLAWWEAALAKNLIDPKYAPASTGLKAIGIVKENYKINSDYEWYSPVKVEDGYHVYIKTRTPSGAIKNVAAFRVALDGTCTRAF